MTPCSEVFYCTPLLIFFKVPECFIQLLIWPNQLFQLHWVASSHSSPCWNRQYAFNTWHFVFSRHYCSFHQNRSLTNPFLSSLLAEIWLFCYSIINVISCVKLSQVLILKRDCYFFLTLSLTSIRALSSVNLKETKTLKLLVWKRNATKS